MIPFKKNIKQPTEQDSQEKKKRKKKKPYPPPNRRQFHAMYKTQV